MSSHSFTPTALITGASSGLGVDFARLLAADHYNLVLVARSEAKMRELGDELAAAHGVAVTVIAADLSRADAAEEVMDQLRSKEISIDTLVNNAGFGVYGPFAENDLQRELEMITVNITAVTHLTKLVLPSMIARGRGRILNVASTAAFQPGPLMAVYYASKAYVLSFSEALANELNGTGVTVTVLCPGATATGFADVADMADSRLFRLSRPMSSAKVARIGYRAMQRGKTTVIAGLRNMLLAQSVRIAPRRLATAIAGKVQERAGA